MSTSLGKSNHLKFIDGFKYQVVEDFVVIIDFKPENDIFDDFCVLYKDGTLLIKKGFCWDGASGITFDSKSSHIAAIVHDALYRLIRHKLLDYSCKKIADKTFLDLLLRNGMNKYRAYLWYYAVVLFGKSSCTTPSRVIDILEIK